MVSKALETATPTLRGVARWLGVSFHSARAYRYRARTAPSEVTRKLSKALRQHAARLVGIADRLDAEAERNP